MATKFYTMGIVSTNTTILMLLIYVLKNCISHSTSIFPFVKFMFLVSRYKKFFY